MKSSFLLIITICFLLFSCKSKNSPLVMQSRAQDSIKSYLTIHLNDPTSYQPVSFDSLSKRISDYTFDDKYFEFNDLAENTLTIESNDLIKNYNLYKKRKSNGYYKGIQNKAINSLDSIKKVFKPKLVGYTLKHTYRAKNGFGALTLSSDTFRLDTALNVLGTTEK